MDHIEKNILDTFITLMREKISIHRVVLFGSRARGDAEPDSDMDVLVVVDDLTEEKEYECPLICSPEELEGV